MFLKQNCNSCSDHTAFASPGCLLLPVFNQASHDSGSALGFIRGRKCLPLSVLSWLASLLISSAFLLQFSQTPEVLAPPQHRLPLQDDIKEQTTTFRSSVKSPLKKLHCFLGKQQQMERRHTYFRQDLLDGKRQKKLTQNCQSHKVRKKGNAYSTQR